MNVEIIINNNENKVVTYITEEPICLNCAYSCLADNITQTFLVRMSCFQMSFKTL